MRYTLIMAGGSGTRLWPMSRANLPKQLIPFIGGKSLLQLAYERLDGLVPAKNRYVCAGQAHADIICRTLGLPKKEFLRRAARTKRRIIAIAHRQANHPAIQKVQDIFRKNLHRLYHWARDPSIPAENNLAERDLRPLVVARKVSFGSQSPAGARTRETLMTILHTLKKRGLPVAPAVQSALDQLVKNPSLNPYSLLFPPPTTKRRRSPR